MVQSLAYACQQSPESFVPPLASGIVRLGREPTARYVTHLLLDEPAQLLIVARLGGCLILTISFHAAKLLPPPRSRLGDF